MALVLVAVIDLIAIIGLIALAQRKGGLERALPFATFLIVLIPIQSSLPLGFFNLTTHRLVVLVLALLYVALGTGSAQQVSRLSLPLKGLILIHVIWSVVAIANSIAPVMSIKKVMSVICEYYILYFIYWKNVSKVETVHRILTAMVFAMFVSSLWGVGEAYKGWNLLDYFPSEGHHWVRDGDAERVDRIHGSFGHPILYGAALAMAITLALYLLTVLSSRWHRFVLWVGLLLMFLNIYKTSSRGPWLDVIAGLLLLMMFGKTKCRRIILYIAALTLVVCIIRPGVWGTIKGIYETTFNKETSSGSSYEYRYALQAVAVQRLQQNPTRAIWGYGPETFYEVHLVGMLLGAPYAFLSCDNAWVEFLVETGYVGLLIMVMLLLQPAWAGLKGYWRGSGVHRHLSLILFINVIIFYFQMYSVGMYSWGQNGYMLWIIIALTLAQTKILKTQPDHGAVRIGSSEVYGVAQAPKQQWGRSEWWQPEGTHVVSWSGRPNAV